MPMNSRDYQFSPSAQSLPSLAGQLSVPFCVAICASYLARILKTLQRIRSNSQELLPVGRESKGLRSAFEAPSGTPMCEGSPGEETRLGSQEFIGIANYLGFVRIHIYAQEFIVILTNSNKIYKNQINSQEFVLIRMNSYEFLRFLINSHEFKLIHRNSQQFV